jgi:prepilin-type N-terminal cleavage/methylation domain-containing protein
MAKYRKNLSVGFTFLEVVIAISILAVIMGTTYSALNQIIRAKKILDDSRDGKAIADALLTRLLRELQLALAEQPVMPPKKQLNQPIPGAPRLTATRSEKQGRSFAELTFVTKGSRQLLPDGTRQADIVQISYKTVESISQNASDPQLMLIREETPYIRPFEEAYKRTISFPVANDLLSFEFLFFDEDTSQWIINWPPKSAARPKLPAMIQLLFKIRSPLGAQQTYSTVIYLPASQVG